MSITLIITETPKKELIDSLEDGLKGIACEILIINNRHISSKSGNVAYHHLDLKGKKAMRDFAVHLAKYDNICIINNLCADLKKLPSTFNLLRKHDMVVGLVNPHGFTLYTKFVNKRKEGFFVLKKQAYINNNGLENIKNIGYVNVIPLYETEKYIIPKFFKPISDIFSFMIYPHYSETDGVKISRDRADFLFIPHIQSAKRIWTVENVGFFIIFGTVAFLFFEMTYALLGISPIILFMFLCSIFYFINWTFKVYLAHVTLVSKVERLSEKELSQIDEKTLPIYTILIPLYKESDVLKQLINHISKINWPKNKLDVKLLLESDDKETVKAAKKCKLPKNFKIMILPHSFPKGKPKALNFGFTQVKGEYTVIYDAEDIMEPDQLKKAYLTFKKSPPNVACVHSKMNFYNKRDNLLTIFFTTEYSYWYELCFPTLIKNGFIVPLGDNSVHFRTEVLKEIGGWDPYNVAEDCESGVRLMRRGYEMRLIDSITHEEAVSGVSSWIKQRSRWMKGFIQTGITNLRYPLRLQKELGWKKLLTFLLIIVGTPLIHLMNLLFWSLTILWFATHSAAIQSIFPWYIFYLAMFSFIFGNFAMIYLNVLGCVNKDTYDLIKWSLLVPFYWVLMGIATFKAFWQIVFNPHHWEKTKHNTSKVIL